MKKFFILLPMMLICVLSLAACLHAHEWIDATCTDPQICSVCNKNEGKALGHDISNLITINEPTCQTVGTASGFCTRCQKNVETNIDKLSHTPGEWEIFVPATLDTSGERTQKCIVCYEVLASETYDLSDEEYKLLFINSCETYLYDNIAREPGQYIGKLAKFTGEVIQVQQSTFLGEINYVLRVNVTLNSDYFESYSDTVYVTYSANETDPRILDNDIITMYGILEGEKTYTTVLGASVTIPSFTAKYIDIE